MQLKLFNKPPYTWPAARTQLHNDNAPLQISGVEVANDLQSNGIKYQELITSTIVINAITMS